MFNSVLYDDRCLICWFQAMRDSSFEFRIVDSKESDPIWVTIFHFGLDFEVEKMCCKCYQPAKDIEYRGVQVLLTGSAPVPITGNEYICVGWYPRYLGIGKPNGTITASTGESINLVLPTPKKYQKVWYGDLQSVSKFRFNPNFHRTCIYSSVNNPKPSRTPKPMSKPMSKP